MPKLPRVTTAPLRASSWFVLLALVLPAQQPPRADELLAAIVVLEGYAPGKQAPAEPAVVAAAERLQRAMDRIVKDPGGPVGRRLQELLDARGAALAPTQRRPVREADPLARTLVRFWSGRLQQTPAAEVRAEPAAAAFPGAVPQTETVVREFAIDLRVPGRHSLGLYAAPGARITLRCAEAPAANELRVRIGAHSDDIGRRPSWPRMPRVARTFPLVAGETLAANAFGGLVYVEVGKPSEAPAKLALTVGGAVPAPRFVLGATDPAQWRAGGRNAPGPWAELATDKVVLTVPSEQVRGLDDPVPVLRFWDRMLDAAADLAARPRQRERPERFVADLEISAGYMHAGYPIMTHLDAAAVMVDLARMQQGPWGLFHELGHNHQSRDWTFGGTGEVTVNLFSLYLCETLCGLGPEQAWGGNLARAEQRLREHLAAGTKPWGGDEGKVDFALRLLMYAQLQREFGWAAFTKVFAEYRALPEAERPVDDAARRDQWLVRFSRSCGRNLGPFFVAWGLPTGEAARASVADLPAWLPAAMRPAKR